jgi:hypothetical protein
MSSAWFYSGDGKGKMGPVSSAQLQALAREGQIKPADLVWKEGMAQWTPGSKINGLFPAGSAAFKASPPDSPVMKEPTGAQPPVKPSARTGDEGSLARAAEGQPIEDAQAVHQQLEELQKQNAILKIDKDWLEERTQHLWEDGFGNVREPIEWMWKFVAIFGAIFGTCMFVLAICVGGAPVGVGVGGVLALIIMVTFAGFSAWYNSRYDRYKRAYAAYQERRAAALKKTPTDRFIG